ncbi:MDR family MFS transporter [Aureibaculum luteum]|uniref:MDR family MFS transporter n=1 Tax=Aureibaculum luteum TaxID=1548456 RepID=UPI000E5062B5|nr:MFS transporter [Aureibaculum luteum]
MKLLTYLNNKIFQPYLDTFNGLSREVWWLALITFVNRAGTMVIPFLSLYLTKHMGFSVSKVGWVMTAFGLGSVVGSWIGGKLTDKIGYYKVMVFSLIGTGFLFVGLQYLTTFYTICMGIFLVMLVADTFRPAMFVALNAYSKTENKARSVTLVRLAINLGFSGGPVIGGLIITAIGYESLFWIDGITCLLAAILLVMVLRPKKARVLDNIIVENPKSVYNDKIFFIFFAAMVLFGFVFLQYFSTMPLYYKDVYQLSEFHIGLLMGFNGFLIFVLEMPLIKKLEDKQLNMVGLMIFGAALMGASLFILNLSHWIGIIIIGMVLMTVGEMILFPFSNAFVMQRAKGGRQGEYMGLYTISFSIAHVFGHNMGMHFVDYLGFDSTWYIMTGLTILCLLLLYWLKVAVEKERLEKIESYK